MAELKVVTIERSSAKLQVIAGEKKTATVPVTPLREVIFERFVRGESERDLATRLKMPVETIRLVLRGYLDIAKRVTAHGDRRFRETHQEVAAEVWSDYRRAA